MNVAGHFLKPDQHFSHYQKHGRAGMMFKPPSVVIAEKHRHAEKQGKQLTSSEIKQLSKDVLLTEEKMWLWKVFQRGEKKEPRRKASNPLSQILCKTNICLCRFS